MVLREICRRLILASASPRRRELLAEQGVAFEVMPSEIAEVGYGGDPALLAQRVTRQKVRAVRARLGPGFTGWILGADTVVALDRDTFGKPRDETDARSMLTRLSGRTHKVHTAFRVETSEGEIREEIVTTEVEMREISAEEIDAYVRSGEPFDKAGAYAIQGLAGKFVKAVRGSRTNVIGLPVEEVLRALRDLGAI